MYYQNGGCIPVSCQARAAHCTNDYGQHPLASFRRHGRTGTQAAKFPSAIVAAAREESEQ